MEKEIDQERQTINNEAIRHQTLINFLKENKGNIQVVQESLKNCLDNKIVDVNQKIDTHNNFHNENMNYLTEQ